jgi:2,5-diamino-6-(ribosylamino)-4(3H)-pyrimidinone 5'-phosphate reductase
MARVYELRAASDAVLVGVETVLVDNPKLTVSERYVARPRQPLRVVLDDSCRTPSDALVVSEAARTLIMTRQGCRKPFPGRTVEVLSGPVGDDGLLDLPWVLSQLSTRGVHQLLVEGGGSVFWSFLSQGLWDELFVYIGPCVVGGVGTPTFASGPGIATAADAIPLCLQDVSRLGPGILVHYQPVGRKEAP